MATDGSLIFNTKMDTSGFDKGVEQISSRILELRNKVKTTENQISSLQDELENLSKTEIKTKISEQLEKDVAKAKENLKSLYAQADKIGDSKKNDLVSMGFGTEHLDSMLAQDEHWQKLQSEIDKAEEALSSYEAELKSVRATEAQIDPTSTAEYKEKKQKLEELTRQLDIYKAKLQETEAKENGTASKTKKVSDIFDRFKKCVSKAGRSLSSAFKAGAVNLIKKIGGHAKKSATEMGGLAKTFNSIKRALQGMIIYKGISKILDSIKVGMQNLAQASPETNKSLSMLMTSLTYLKNTLATAFAPILNAVAPILNYFINLLAQVTDKIGQFMAALTGQKTYTKAVKVQQDYAESIKDTTSATEKNTKATDENQKWLSGYDELNVMQDSKASADSSDDKNTITPSDMFTTETVSNGISGFANQLKSLIEAEDFSGLGQLIGSKINSALSNINWNKIRSTSKKWAMNLVNFLNGGMLEIDWNLVGKSIGNGLMTAFDFAYTFLTKFDFKTLGTKIADALEGLFNSFNWSTVGGTFGAALQSIISIGFGFVTTFAWGELGKSISNMVNGFFNQINWSVAGQTLTSSIVGVFNTLSTALSTVNWEQIGKDIGMFLANIDWWSVLVSAAQAIWSAIVGFVQMLAGVWEENPIAAIIMTIVAALGVFAAVMAIVNAVMMVNPVTWIVLGIVALIAAIVACIVYWDEICAAIQSAWAWICELFSNVGKWIWNNLISPVIGFFKTLWSSVCEIFQNISDFIKGIWEGIWSVIKGFINTIIDGINMLWSGIYSAVSGIVNGIGGIAGAIGDLFGQDWHFSMPSEPPLIPKLATGAYVPAHYGEFLAVLGDNKREGEFVAPESKLEQAVINAMGKVNVGYGGDTHITLVMPDGSVLFKTVIKENDSFKMRHGYSALT